MFATQKNINLSKNWSHFLFNHEENIISMFFNTFLKFLISSFFIYKKLFYLFKTIFFSQTIDHQNSFEILIGLFKMPSNKSFVQNFYFKLARNIEKTYPSDILHFYKIFKSSQSDEASP